MTTYLDTDVDEFLSHFGVKGMRWGVRNEEGPSFYERHQKAIVIGGSVATAALITAGTVYLAKNGDIPISSFSSSRKDAGKKFIDETLSPSHEEVTKIVHITGAGYLGDRTQRTGGLRDVFGEAKRAGLADETGAQPAAGHFKRYGPNLDKVAVSFADPSGRKDFSGRPIVHHIILPKQYTSDITNFDQAKAKAWELVKDDYNKFSEYANRTDANNAEARRRGLMD